MRAINQSELEILVGALAGWVGASVQKIFSSEREFGLGLWTKEGLKWIWISLEKSNPVILPLSEIPEGARKKTTPVGLFLNAHVKNKMFTGVSVKKSVGRVVILNFENCEVEVRLYAQGVNLLVFAEQKKISFEKVKEVSQSQQNLILGPSRSVIDILVEWQSSKIAPPSKNVTPIEKGGASNSEKKLIAISKIEKDIAAKADQRWRELGEWLKANQTNQVPKEFLGLIDARKTWSQNLAQCFVEAKKIDEKIKKARARIEKLKQEIELGVVPTQREKENVFKGAEAKGRTLHLKSSTAFMGRSAQDNLKILRNANPWDLWLHLRERPSAHVVISSPKGQKIAEEEIKKVGEWLIRESFKKNFIGIAYEIIICECRHVKPIKGQSIGRVHFQNERILRLKVEA